MSKVRIKNIKGAEIVDLDLQIRQATVLDTVKNAPSFVQAHARHNLELQIQQFVDILAPTLAAILLSPPDQSYDFLYDLTVTTQNAAKRYRQEFDQREASRLN